MGALCTPVRQKDILQGKSPDSALITQESNAEELQPSRNLQDQQAVLQSLGESAAAQVAYSSLLQKEALAVKTQLQHLAVRVFSHFLKRRPKAALVQWRHNLQLRKLKRLLESSKTQQILYMLKALYNRTVTSAFSRILYNETRAFESTLSQTAEDVYQEEGFDCGKRKGAVRSIVCALQRKPKTAIRSWKVCVDKLKIETLVTALETQRLQNASSRTPKSVLEPVGDHHMRDRLKGALREVMRGLTVRPKLALKTWKRAAEQAKMQVSLQKTENRNIEVEGQMQKLVQRMKDQKKVFSGLKQENHGLKSQINDLFAQLYAFQPALNPQLLFAVTKYTVKCFDPTLGRYQQLFSLRQEIQVNYNSSAACISSNRIFVCGGGLRDGCIYHIGKCAYILEEDGTVRQQPDMLIGRYTCGVIWDRVAEALYVFGGGSNGGIHYSVLLRSCELFKSSQWQALPEMHQARSHFNPCWYSSVVYLCGGHCTSVEIYDPRSNAFTLLSGIALPEANECSVGVESGVLILLVGNYIAWLRDGRLTCQQRLGSRSWSNCAPVVVGGGLYSLSLFENLCRGVNLRTGTTIKDFPLG